MMLGNLGGQHHLSHNLKMTNQAYHMVVDMVIGVGLVVPDSSHKTTIVGDVSMLPPILEVKEAEWVNKPEDDDEDDDGQDEEEAPIAEDAHIHRWPQDYLDD